MKNKTRHSALWESIVMLRVTYTLYAECHYAECCYAEHRGAVLVLGTYF